jgi:hypothetical protein
VHMARRGRVVRRLLRVCRPLWLEVFLDFSSAI